MIFKICCFYWEKSGKLSIQVDDLPAPPFTIIEDCLDKKPGIVEAPKLFIIGAEKM